jgi:ADP-ribose pyrophosphatase YjhB (NUDIX family)
MGRFPLATPENRGPAPHDLHHLADRLGPPRRWRFCLPMQENEFQVFHQTGSDGRWQDATILIEARHLDDAPVYDTLGTDGLTHRPGSFIAIAKTWYPEHIYRYPSGTVRPGEGVVGTALRESAEETGIEVRLTRYLLATEGQFYLGAPEAPERTHPWCSHVFLAEPIAGKVDPQDLREIREARVVGSDEMLHRIHPRLLTYGLGGFAYRVGLQERALHVLGLNHGPWRIVDDPEETSAPSGS